MKLFILDCETTGLDPSKHEIIEIGAVNVATGETFEVKVHPVRIKDADPKALLVNGYDKAQWRDEAFLPFHALTMLTEFVGEGATLMSYNISFDKAFLEAAYREAQLPYPFHYAPLCLMTMAYVRGDWVVVPSLKKACWYFEVPEEPSVHRALVGALTAFELYKKL